MRASSGTTILVPATPAVPATKNLDTYAWGTPLYPEGTQSAYTVYLQNPRDPARFDVYGFDPKRNVTLFHGEGSKRVAAEPTMAQIQRDISSLGPDVQSGASGQIDVPLPNPPGPHIHDATLAWQQAFQAWQVDIGAAVKDTGPIITPAQPGAPAP